MAELEKAYRTDIIYWLRVAIVERFFGLRKEANKFHYAKTGQHLFEAKSQTLATQTFLGSVFQKGDKPEMTWESIQEAEVEFYE